MCFTSFSYVSGDRSGRRRSAGRRCVKTGEGDLRTSGVYQTGEACGTREKEDDILASRKEDVKMNGERRRMMEYRIQ